MTTFEIIMMIISTGIAGGILRLTYSVGKISEKIENMQNDIKEIKSDIKSLDKRLSRLEGAFYERGYWESRYTGTEKEQ